MSRDTVVVVTPSGCIGNRGIDRGAFIDVLDRERPDVVAVDSGSLDCGPWYLGTGQAHSPHHNIRRDLDIVLTECVGRGIPFITGTAGGSGARAHVDLVVDMARDIARERGLRFDLGVAYSDLDKETLKARLRDGVVMPRVPADILGEPLSESEVDRCDSIVAMMGSEPLIKLISDGADVVVAGRASDCSVIGAFPIMKGFDRGLSLHMGDIMECGENALIDVDNVTHRAGPNRTGIVGEIGSDSFVIRSGHPGMACTVESALGHSMYERETHSTVELPGGTLDKTACRIEAEGERAVRISGTAYRERPYTVLLEGAGLEGWRSIAIQGVRNPTMIEQIDSIVGEEIRNVESQFEGAGRFTVFPHVYGKGAVLGDSELPGGASARELCLVLDVVAESQRLAHDVVEDLALKIAFSRYPGRTTTAGNVAYLFSPNVIDAGRAYSTTVYHEMPLDDPLEPFRFEHHAVG